MTQVEGAHRGKREFQELSLHSARGAGSGGTAHAGSHVLGAPPLDPPRARARGARRGCALGVRRSHVRGGREGPLDQERAEPDRHHEQRRGGSARGHCGPPRGDVRVITTHAEGTATAPSLRSPWSPPGSSASRSSAAATTSTGTLAKTNPRARAVAPRGRARCERRFCLWRRTPRPCAFPFPGSRTMTNRKTRALRVGPLRSVPRRRARRRRRLSAARRRQRRARRSRHSPSRSWRASCARCRRALRKRQEPQEPRRCDALRDLRLRPSVVVARGASVEQARVPRRLVRGKPGAASARRREDRAEDRQSDNFVVFRHSRKQKQQRVDIGALSVARRRRAGARRGVARRELTTLLRERRRERDAGVRERRRDRRRAARRGHAHADAEHALDDGIDNSAMDSARAPRRGRAEVWRRAAWTWWSVSLSFRGARRARSPTAACSRSSSSRKTTSTRFSARCGSRPRALPRHWRFERATSASRRAGSASAARGPDSRRSRTCGRTRRSSRLSAGSAPKPRRQTRRRCGARRASPRARSSSRTPRRRCTSCREAARAKPRSSPRRAPRRRARRRR